MKSKPRSVNPLASLYEARFNNAMMDYYTKLRPILFKLPPEVAHNLALYAMSKRLIASPKVEAQHNSLNVTVAGLNFANPVGLAAGFDKNADTVKIISRLGFGFAEFGTVTPKPQLGNPKPRVFRVEKHEAVINRLGFNNAGLDSFVKRLMLRQAGSGVIGANIGKNKDSTDAVADYVTGARAVYSHADYITLNISSPNTVGLRDLQEESALRALVHAVQQVRQEAMAAGMPYKPLFIKLAPDLLPDQMDQLAAVALELTFDALILGNTTISRPKGFENPDWAQGGLSGKPLFIHSTETLRQMALRLQGRIPLIGVGGIGSAEDAYAKIRAGASAVQIYTALIYKGPQIVGQINQGLAQLLTRDGFASVRDAVGADL